MQKKRVKIAFLIKILLLITMLLYGCNNEVVEEDNGVKDKIELSNGAMIIENLGEYSVYNVSEDKYEDANINKIILFYNLMSKNFIYSENDKYKVNYNDNEIIIGESKNIVSPKLSKNGEYISYFLREPYLELKIKDLSNNSEIKIESKVSISGDLLDWIDEKTIVYYGVDDNKNNGIFLYDIDKNEERLLYKFDLGYVEFLKALDNGVIFLQSREGKEKLFKIVDKEGEVKEIIKGILDVSDVELTSEGIFILGRLEDNTYSLYKYSEGKAKRLIYDFPKLINLEKGIAKDKDEDIIFIGGEESKTEKVYKYKDDTVTTISVDEGNYHFIKFN